MAQARALAWAWVRGGPGVSVWGEKVTGFWRRPTKLSQKRGLGATLISLNLRCKAAAYNF